MTSGIVDDLEIVLEVPRVFVVATVVLAFPQTATFLVRRRTVERVATFQAWRFASTYF